MSQSAQAAGLLSQYGFIYARGADAGSFLQAQLSADILALEKNQSLLTGWHNPKGRVLCCLKVFAAEDGYWIALPILMVDLVITGLQGYIFRSKVTLSVASDLAMGGCLTDMQRQEFFGLTQDIEAQLAIHRAAGARDLIADEWELAEIRAGLPEVTPATTARFTGQMLNLDLIGGISFTKGCYPGQEIIARTHHLGRAKRRMHRYVSTGPAQLAGVDLHDEQNRRAGQVVRSATTTQGSESLVVATVVPPQRLVAEDGAHLDIASLPYPLTPPA